MMPARAGMTVTAVFPQLNHLRAPAPKVPDPCMTRSGAVVTDTAGANFTSLDTYEMREAAQPQSVAAPCGFW